MKKDFFAIKEFSQEGAFHNEQLPAEKEPLTKKGLSAKNEPSAKKELATHEGDFFEKRAFRNKQLSAMSSFPRKRSFPQNGAIHERGASYKKGTFRRKRTFYKKGTRHA